MKKLFKLLVALAMVMCLAACGSSSSSSDSSDAKTYTIATDTTFAPFEFADDAGEMVGIDMDLIRAIAEDQGIAIKINSVGFDAAMTAVESGEADGMIAGMTINDARKEKYDFSDPYYTSGVTLAVRADSNIKGYEDLKGKTVVAKTSTSGYEFADSIAKKYGFSIKVVEQSSVMYEDLKNGEVDALFEDTPVIKYAIATGQQDFKLPCENESPCEYGFAVKKGENAELLAAFNKGLANLKANGKYDEIVDKYTKVD
ncbi:MAG: transporter substrate-binding domain-containing protein [Erysipelotrichaceae bacterium]|nr:transporter substrate-binding domain-containing protein [Erysipelotrichaceae bacterium]